MSAKTKAASVVLACTVLFSPAATAQFGQTGYRDPGGWDLDLTGLKVDTAKSRLAEQGYAKARNIQVDGRQYDLWFNQRAGERCIGFTSYYGRVTDVRGFRESLCGLDSWPDHGDFTVDSLTGLRVDDAKHVLISGGFDHSHNVHIRGRQWDLWASRSNWFSTCVGFTSFRGVVTAAREFELSECAESLPPATWPETDTFIGITVNQAKNRLVRGGFSHSHNIMRAGRQWDLWVNVSSREPRCIGFTSFNGRITDARYLRWRDCR